VSLLVDCAGAPRDVGLDQGRACRAELNDRFAEIPWTEALALRLGRADASVRRVQRDLARYFPHLSEALAGLAVGARVPESFLAGEIAADLASAAAPAAALAGETAQLALALDGPAIVRRTRPEGLFASLELSRPWLPSTLLGVNERGLAVAVADSGPGEVGCSAPAALLAQDCLERFEALDAALDWCAGRPGGGRATLFFGDAAGEVAGIEIAGSEHRVLRPADGLLARDGVGAELAKSLREAPPGAAQPTEVARVDSRERSLTLAGASYRL
jgi:hypothetical protein